MVAPLVLGGCITVNLGGGRPGPLEEVAVSGEGRHKVAVVDLTGIILGETRTTLFGLSPLASMVDRVQAQLDRAAEDGNVKAVVLRVNSPGGTVTASDVIYQAVRRFKEKKKVPVVASLIDFAASGGYYVAMASDEILAHPTTITGSIGVIVQNTNVSGLYDKLGLSDQTVKSGPYKDLGSSRRVPTPQERAIVQSVVDGMFGRFLAVVQAGRPRLPPERIRALADGRVYLADQALANGLVDGVGYMQDAVDAAKARAGLEEATVVLYVRPGGARPTHLYAAADDAPRPATAADVLLELAGRSPGPQVLYLWTGF